MEVTALCSRPTMIVSLLLLVTVDLGSAQRLNSPQVVPYRQQHFEYDPIVVSCEGLDGQTGWRVVKKVNGHTTPCQTKMEETGPCTMSSAFSQTDSGEYWCEKTGQKKSSVFNITVTGLGVILESPVHAVKEGDAVNLICRKKEIFSNLSAEFIKHGHFFGNSSTGHLTISSVSTSDEGYYSCKISGEESLKSWLAVRAAEADDDTPSSHFYLLVITGLSILALLLLVGFVIFRKRQTIFAENATTSSSSYKSSSDRKHPRAGSANARSTVQSDSEVVYALVTRPR